MARQNGAGVCHMVAMAGPRTVSKKGSIIFSRKSHQVDPVLESQSLFGALGFFNATFIGVSRAGRPGQSQGPQS